MTEHCRWLTRREAAAYLRMHPKTFDRAVREGRVTKYSATSPRVPLFDRRELDQLVLASGANS